MSAKTTNGVKGTPQDKKQTKLIQGKSGSVIAASRGKRKLDLDSQRFKGKIMFLDLAGYRRTPEIEYELTERGATVEKFFHRGVKYLVTNRPKTEGQKSQSTPSPHTPSTTHSVGKSSWSQLVSPMTDSPSGTVKQQPPAYQTRAQKLLRMSLEKKNAGKKVDIVAMAAGWGCKVVQLEELLAELKRLKPLPKKEGSQMITHGGRQARVHQLHTPFFKVEALSRCYRPLVCEMKEWPRPDPFCSPKACPFDSPRRAKAIQHTTRHPQASPDHPHAHPHAHLQLHHPPTHPEEKRPGYCECCAQRYDDLYKHLKSTRHQEYASNPANFASLDVLIEQGTSFAAFIAGVKRKHDHHQREEHGPLLATSQPLRRLCETPRRTPASLTQWRREESEGACRREAEAERLVQRHPWLQQNGTFRLAFVLKSLYTYSLVHPSKTPAERVRARLKLMLENTSESTGSQDPAPPPPPAPPTADQLASIESHAFNPEKFVSHRSGRNKQDPAPSVTNSVRSFAITEVDPSEYEQQVVELPPSPPPPHNTSKKLDHGDEEDGGTEGRGRVMEGRRRRGRVLEVSLLLMPRSQTSQSWLTDTSDGWRNFKR